MHWDFDAFETNDTFVDWKRSMKKRIYTQNYISFHFYTNNDRLSVFEILICIMRFIQQKRITIQTKEKFCFYNWKFIDVYVTMLIMKIVFYQRVICLRKLLNFLLNKCDLSNIERMIENSFYVFFIFDRLIWNFLLALCGHTNKQAMGTPNLANGESPCIY